jgi:hypothetical protein
MNTLYAERNFDMCRKCLLSPNFMTGLRSHFMDVILWSHLVMVRVQVSVGL